MENNENQVSQKRLTSKAKRILRAKSHEIKPVVWIGKEGVDKVIEEVKRQLKDRGLIKVKIRRTALIYMDKKEIAEKLAKETDSEIVSIVGHVITLFRPREGWKRYTSKKTKKEKEKEKAEQFIAEFEKLRKGKL
ncbi:ribosome assembly RNA-binding protein YhbY [Methanotorris igneus]|uniref:RNA-binding, CRM domain protein n=1 Tax=Methanotorris igneus (strain DSM 5666 / JCM 11834 / Kol 5) TaxID=880724 RepID=F6BCD5_METIK|nr:ribosome assembly RNA-binding protein YhbY [Methanotorris igneus]AEF96146.1 RNA-binding, CRM domain protein [Methanotorris igneus Kol 5]